ncbi:MAG: hypothetical protein SGI77_01130 [Pirellulaceae bacterium]|nr:hypothetical protein [Pirellulaceae bacterium]
MLLAESKIHIGSRSIFSVDRISRQGDRFLGRLRMDAETLQSLRQDNIGLLFEKFLRLETMLGRIMPLANRHDLGKIAIVYSSKVAGAYIYEMLCHEGFCVPTKKPPVSWEMGSLVFASVERLSKLDRRHDGTAISIVMLLDSSCMVQRARTKQYGNGRTHDRPQLLVNALCDLATDGLHPMFAVMTCKPAISIATEQLARIYCRETWWFCDGPSMTF